MESSSFNCFTCQQLSDFVANKMNSNEQTHFQQHVLQCDLCSYAVKGFEFIPFTQNDIVDINKNVNKVINKQKLSINTIKHACFAGVAIVVIFAFYNFVDSFSNKPIVLSTVALEMTVPTIEKTESSMEREVVTIKKIQKKNRKTPLIKKERTIVDVPMSNKIEPIKIVVNEEIQKNKEIKLELLSIANAVYFHNLKVADYFNLYFQSKGQKTVNFNNHIPSFKENKSLQNNFDTDIDSRITLEAILKNGLFYFSEENYSNCINEFQNLLGYSPNDINALFYVAMAYKNNGNYQKAAIQFNRVLNHTDKTFSAEAKWHLAKTYVAMKKMDIAKQLFLEIIAENGFYAEHSKKELSLMKGL